MNQKTRIALAAPTGKGAAKLLEAIKREKDRMDCPEHIKAAIPREASTIHRLLGSMRRSPYFRFNARNPLPFETVVVDEASMVDLALMSKLVQALPHNSRLILSGDENQLASVEAGAVLGDICNRDGSRLYSGSFCRDLYNVTGVSLKTDIGNNQYPGIRDCIVRLQKNYRFRSDSGIGALCRAVIDGDADRSFEILQDSRFDDVGWADLGGYDCWTGQFKNAVKKGFGGYLRPEDPEETFQRFDQFRVLCAIREGPYGVISANRMVEDALKAQKWIQPDTPWYAGRPIMVTRNDYQLQLFNGDVGMMLPDQDGVDHVRVVFFAPDGTLRRFHPVRLPDHETVFAMSVHKSQGSEFKEVLLLLPDRDSPVLTRELLYTGISRARNRVRIWGRKEIFKTAVSRRIQRMSGLRDALWEQVR